LRRLRRIFTAVNGTGAPTPAQIEQAFDAASAGAALVVAYTRGEAHGVLALVK
jgi:hypothetical protein